MPNYIPSFLTALVLLCQVGMAQSTFNKVVSSSANTAGIDFVQTADGGYFLAYQEFAIGDSSGSVLLRLNPGGTVLWEKKYLTPNASSFAYFNELVATPDGNLLISDVYRRFMKLDTLGNILWAKGLDYPSAEPGEFSTMTVGAQGNIAIATSDPQQYARFLICDPNGNKLHLQTSMAFRDPTDIDPTPDGGYLLTGRGSAIVKTDSAGVIEWQTGQSNALSSNFLQSVVLPDGSITCIGSTDAILISQTEMQMTHFSATGNLEWAASYPFQPGVFGREIVRTNDGGYLIAGAAFGNLLLIKTDSSGVPQWSRFSDTDGMDDLIEMHASSDGTYAMLGREGVSPNVTARFIKVGGAGFDGCSLDSTSVFYVDSTQSLFGINTPATNAVTDTLHTETYSITTPTSSLTDACIPTHTRDESLMPAAGFRIFPNPSNGPFTIQSEWNDGKPTRYRLYDISGRELKTYSYSGSNHQFNLEIHKPGMYLIRATHGNRSQTEKIIVSSGG